MIKLYYEIWVDALVGAIEKDIKGWKIYLMLIIVFCQSIVFMNVIVILEMLTQYKFYDLEFLGEKWNTIPNGFKGMILYSFPFIALNYILIFYNERYSNLVKVYKYHNGKYFVNYILISGAIAFIGILTLFLIAKPK